MIWPFKAQPQTTRKELIYWFLQNKLELVKTFFLAAWYAHHMPDTSCHKNRSSSKFLFQACRKNHLSTFVFLYKTRKGDELINLIKKKCLSNCLWEFCWFIEYFLIFFSFSKKKKVCQEGSNSKLNSIENTLSHS